LISKKGESTALTKKHHVITQPRGEGPTVTKKVRRADIQREQWRCAFGSERGEGEFPKRKKKRKRGTRGQKEGRRDRKTPQVIAPKVEEESPC